jgi:AraC family transcriptional regulator
LNNILKYGEYYGSINNSIDVDGLLLTETIYQPHSTIPPHYHENCYFCFVTNGGYTERFSGSTMECEKGDLILHPVSYKHSNSFDSSRVTCLNIELGKEWFYKYRLFLKPLDTVRKIKNNAFPLLASKINKEILEPDEFSPLVIEALTIQLLADIERENRINDTRKPFWITKVEEFLHEGSSDNIKIDSLAAIAGVHPVHLSRTFKKFNDVSIGEYTRNIKVKKATEMLLRTAAPLSQIAFECGFSDQSHFIKIFKKHIGLTPKEFRHLSSN